MEDASNMVQILVACAMQGIWFSSMNYLRWGRTKETGSQMKACAIYIIRFTRMNCLWLGKRTKMVQYNKMCVIRSKQVCNQKCVQRPIITQTIASNKMYVICSVYTTYIGHCGSHSYHQGCEEAFLSARTSCSSSSSCKKTIKLSVLRLEQPSDGWLWEISCSLS